MKLEDFQPFVGEGRHANKPLLVQLVGGPLILAAKGDGMLAPASVPNPEAAVALARAKLQKEHDDPITFDDVHRALTPDEVASLPQTFVPPLPALPVKRVRIDGAFVVLIFDGMMSNVAAPEIAVYVPPEEIRAISMVEDPPKVQLFGRK